jgi:hypothetical protein
MRKPRKCVALLLEKPVRQLEEQDERELTQMREVWAKGGEGGERKKTM